LEHSLVDICVDQITIEAARRGDRDAQARLLKQLQDPWFRFCLGLLGGSQEDACDAVQETALRVLRDLPRFRGESSLMTWSMGIAINVTREIKRRRTTRLPSPQQQEADPQAAIQIRGTASADERASDRESHGLLRATLADLPERQREALVLRFFEGLSVEQTAELMGCATGTVKATVHQALRALKTRLKQLS
jgi:RNA polymerase sigma-70 factor (ECF subfamily)